MIPRRKSKPIQIGNVTIGGDAPLIRVAVPDVQAAQAIKEIKQAISIPLVADIHFDYRLALLALKAGADGLRLNPGNIGDPDKIAAIVKVAKDRNVPIRIGVNAGSLPKISHKNLSIPRQMVIAALQQIKLLESLDFDLIKVSLKAFDVPTTIKAYQDIAKKIPYPLHIGITESGPPSTGVIRSAVGIGTLLYKGIGDTIRVSLSAHPREEVIAAYEILKSLNLRQHGPVLVSCPTCGRTEVDLVKIVEAVEKELGKINKPIKVAVMGCVVNGPGEAKDADIGIACGKGKAVLFKKGEKIAVVKEDNIIKALMNEVAKT
jgi:(E)-4-hydroxy-3-methylbut-2-enyl-diphosphate synthase